jgi:steroid delta-isomerase-like uncharacterized protein
MSDANKNVIRRVLDEIWSKGNMAVADELFSPNYAHHDPSSPDLGQGPEGEKRRANLYRSAFPDLRFTVEDVIADGDRVVARYSARGTHKGELNGIPATGKQITVTGMTVARIANGKVAESYVNWDALGLMQQLGVVPENAAKTKAAAR